MRNSKEEDDGAAKSLFLAALMIGSVMVGGLFYDFESEGSNLAPIIESDIPNSILIGTVENLEISLVDEDINALDIQVTLDGYTLNIEPNSTGILVVDISEVLVGTHTLKMIVTDSLGQESRLSASFTIHYPYEDPTVMVVDNNEINLVRGENAIINGTLIHPDLDTCDLGWSDSDINDFSLNLPFSDNGMFTWGPSEIESNLTISILATCGTWEDSSDLEIISINVIEPVQGCTDSEANNYDSDAIDDDGSCEYDEEPIIGCTDSEANNFDITATEDDGTCSYDEPARLKILSLHGGGESASDFQNQQGMQDLIEALPEFEFIFAETSEDGGVWVRDPPGGKEQGTNDPNWADESINYLDDFILENGPFYGLLGYSQGAAMSVIYLAYSDVEFEKVILFNGYLETGHQGLNDTIENESPFDIPALVFEGEDDDWFGYGSTELANVFTDVIHIVGDAGHHLPYSSDREFDTVISFIRDVVQYGCTDSSASNFDQDANLDDGSCNYDEQSSEGGSIAITWLNPPNNGLIMISLFMLATVTRFSLRELASDSSAPNQVGKAHEYRLIPRLA